MSNVINCPKCERQLRVPDELIGQSVKCPSCGETFTAELSKKEPPPPSSSPSRPTPRPRDEDEDDRPSRRRPIRRDDDDYDEDRRSRRLTPHRGDMIQIMGILAFIPVMGLPFILGPIAWVMGNTDLAEMDAGRIGPGWPQSHGNGTHVWQNRHFRLRRR